MGKAAKITYVEMVEHAVHSAGKNKKLSRRKIKDFLANHWDVKIDSASVRESLKTVMTEEVNNGILVKEKDSFGFSPEGKKKYAETYAGNAPQDPEQDGTDDDEEEENTPTKKTKGKKAAAAEEDDE